MVVNVDFEAFVVVGDCNSKGECRLGMLMVTGDDESEGERDVKGFVVTAGVGSED